MEGHEYMLTLHHAWIAEDTLHFRLLLNQGHEESAKNFKQKNNRQD